MPATVKKSSEPNANQIHPAAAMAPSTMRAASMAASNVGVGVGVMMGRCVGAGSGVTTMMATPGSVAVGVGGTLVGSSPPGGSGESCCGTKVHVGEGVACAASIVSWAAIVWVAASAAALASNGLSSPDGVVMMAVA